jgi:hypothetical protein
MDKESSPRPDEVESVFRRSIGVIHSALISYYWLTEDEAKGAEEDLLAWFRRLARRGSARQAPVELLRISLLSAACHYGRSFQLWKLGGTQSESEHLRMVLSREPEEVAKELDRRLEERQT